MGVVTLWAGWANLALARKKIILHTQLKLCLLPSGELLAPFFLLFSHCESHINSLSLVLSLPIVKSEPSTTGYAKWKRVHVHYVARSQIDREEQRDEKQEQGPRWMTCTARAKPGDIVRQRGPTRSLVSTFQCAPSAHTRHTAEEEAEHKQCQPKATSLLCVCV